VNLKILREAEIELSEAIGRYEGIEPGLGLRLKDEVRRALVWILGLERVMNFESGNHGWL
jgi:hypothetical protein